MKENVRVLITVKTYPNPSYTYKETVCTAGVLEDGSFIRLYPIDYRYRDYAEQFKKYQWVRLDVVKRTRDTRPESYSPILTSMKFEGEPLSTKDCWKERKAVIFKKPVFNMCELNSRDRTECSLGIIKPISVSDFKAKPRDREWTGKQKAAMQSLWLDGPPKNLVKIPYRFTYHYKCSSPQCSGHKQMIEDWEVGQLFLKERSKYGEAEAVKKVKYKFFNQICSKENDTYFFVGRVNDAYANWVVLGCFYPKITPMQQAKLPLTNT